MARKMFTFQNSIELSDMYTKACSDDPIREKFQGTMSIYACMLEKRYYLIFIIIQRLVA